MKKRMLKGRTITIISTLFFFLSFYITYFLHLSSMFYLYYFISMTAVLFLSSNLLFISLWLIKKLSERYQKSEKKPLRRFKAFFSESRLFEKIRKKKKTRSAEESEAQQAPAKKKKKLNIKMSRLLMLACFLIYFRSFYVIVKGIALYIQMRPFEIFDYPINAVVMLVFALVCLVLDRFCKHSENNSEFTSALLDNNRTFLKLTSLEFIATSVSVFTEYYARLSLQKIIGNALAALFFYYAFFVLISMIIIIVRKDCLVRPLIKIPVPSLKRGKKEKDGGFIDYLEKNTGISMRSLWSVKFIKKIAPAVVISCVFVFWLSTSVVYVKSCSQAAVYRIGRLRDKILPPGIHFILPYPFDKVEIYDTEKLNKTTIGYNSDSTTDNIWTSSHGGSEYKLLLGGGDELVSINLRLEYKIDDLKKYLTVSSSPEALMQASAYELVLGRTITTDLSSLLSIDRYAFANTFKETLNKALDEKGIGLEVVSVVLESIHPPVDIAEVYQSLISAEITAGTYISEAEGYAAVKKADAETQKNTSIGEANADHMERTAKAKSSAAQFTASAEAYKSYDDAYTYQKYLNAVAEAYGKANLVILSDGIDSSSIYFGSFSDRDKKTEAGGQQTEG